MTRDVFVLVESNTTGTGRLFPAAARTLGLHPVLLAADPSRYASVGGAEVVRTDTDDVRAVVDACRGLAVGRRVAGVATSSDYYVETAAAAATALGLPANSPADLAAVRDKGTQRARLAAAGVRVPRFTVAGSVEEVLAAAAETGYPVVVKPVTGSGSLGVLLCADPEQTAEHARALLSRGSDERGRPVPRRVTVEEFVSGAEYSAEVLDGTVAGITAKHLGAPPLFVETGHDFPAALAPAVRKAVTETAEAAVRALGIVLGPAHVELRLGPEGPVLIEVNPGWRAAGSPAGAGGDRRRPDPGHGRRVQRTPVPGGRDHGEGCRDPVRGACRERPAARCRRGGAGLRGPRRGRRGDLPGAGRGDHRER